jgi:hypothetical protein
MALRNRWRRLEVAPPCPSRATRIKNSGIIKMHNHIPAKLVEADQRAGHGRKDF